ncbi:MAG: hypothetical protein ACLPX1_09975 [Steroidobacteraceae bacterium]
MAWIGLAPGTVGSFLSVIEDAGGHDPSYHPPIIDMFESICAVR